MSVRIRLFAIGSLTAVVTLAPGCKSEVRGSCEVIYDAGGPLGEACTGVREEGCVDNIIPAINMMSTTKKKAFVAGKTCQDLGYTQAGCADVPLAWSFKGACPR